MDDDALYCARCGLYRGATVRGEAPLNFDKEDDTPNFDQDEAEVAPLNFDKDDEEVAPLDFGKDEDAPLNFDKDDEVEETPLDFEKDEDAPLNFDKDDEDEETPPPPPQRRWNQESTQASPTFASQERRTSETPRDERTFPNGDANRPSEEPDYAPKNFADALVVCVGKKYCVFQGRAGRSEYWMFYAWQWILAFVTTLLTGAPFLAALALIVPAFAALARRLHDAGYSARHLLWAAAPVAGWVVLLVLALQPSTPGPNRFGSRPTKPPRGSANGRAV